MSERKSINPTIEERKLQRKNKRIRYLVVHLTGSIFLTLLLSYTDGFEILSILFYGIYSLAFLNILTVPLILQKGFVDDCVYDFFEEKREKVLSYEKERTSTLHREETFVVGTDVGYYIVLLSPNHDKVINVSQRVAVFG